MSWLLELSIDTEQNLFYSFPRDCSAINFKTVSSFTNVIKNLLGEVNFYNN